MKKNKTLFIILGIIATSLIVAFIILFPRINFIGGKQVLEKGIEYKAEYFIESANGDVSYNGEILDTSEVGDYSYTYKVKKWVFEREIDYKYEVADTTAPVISFKKPIISIDPYDELDDSDIKDNIIINEGTYEYATNFNAEFSDTYLVNVKASDEYGNVSESSFEIVVRDIEAPFVFRSGDYSEILLDEEFNIYDYVAYGDNADPKPVLTCVGEVDTSKMGDYLLHLKLEDKSGNVTEWDATITVTDYIDYDDSDDDYRYPFSEFISDYAGEDRHFGLDISEWQEDVDFEKLKAQGVEFVILRIGFSYLGKMTIDSEFEDYFAAAKAAGIPVGIYLFCYDNSEEDLLKSMDMMFEVLGDEKLELPIVFDWEDFWCFNEYEMSFQDLNYLYRVFEREVTNRGYKSMLYGSKYYLQEIWNIDDTPIWLAQYYDYPTYDKPFEIWQLTDVGSMDGVNGRCDFNIMYGDELLNN